MIGEELGSYRVIEPIGKGGMASVFIGEHAVLGHRVAIKVLHQANPDNPMVERRFINEAKAIAAIRHPGIVELFDFGRGPDGRAYIVMELLNGETLRNRLRRGAMPVRQALVFARQIASAVAVAHDAHIIHRDLKPDNIFLIPDSEVEFGERVKVLDFGVAKQMGMREPSEQTATGVLIGTPAYMSPEQCKGTGDIDHRADIYSLGIVLYRMVTGQLPFESAGTGELIGKHIYEEPPTAHDIDPDIPVELSELIQRCMAKNPIDRFTDMHAVVDMLRDLLDDDDESDTMRPQPPVVENAERGPVGKSAHEDDELTRPTTLRAMTGQAFVEPDIDSGRWAVPLTIIGVLALGAFVALLIVTTGDEVAVPTDDALEHRADEVQPAAVTPAMPTNLVEPAVAEPTTIAEPVALEPSSKDEPSPRPEAATQGEVEAAPIEPAAPAKEADDGFAAAKSGPDAGVAAAPEPDEVELVMDEDPPTEVAKSTAKPAMTPEKIRSPNRVRKTESDKPKNPKSIRVPALY